MRKLLLKGNGAARLRPPRGRAWLSGDMVSPYKARFNLRETTPLSQTLSKAQKRLMRQRPNPNELLQQGYRDWSLDTTSPKLDAGYRNYPASGRDTAESGKGCNGKCRLTHLAESIFVNVGGCYQDANVSSPQMLDSRVGGFIVVRAWESQAQGEGSQGIDTLPVPR